MSNVQRRGTGPVRHWRFCSSCIHVKATGNSWESLIRSYPGSRQESPRNSQKIISPRIFTSDTMHSADYMLSRDVLLSCLSVTRLYSVETAKHIIKVFFSLSGKHTILVFPYQTRMVTFRWEPPKESIECKNMKKIAIFVQYLALSQKWYEIAL